MEEIKWLNYWKKSLSDSQKAEINLIKPWYFGVDNFVIESENINEIHEAKNLIDAEERRKNNQNGISDKDSLNWVNIEHIEVLISPFKIESGTENQPFQKDNETKYPFLFYAKLNRSGVLQIPVETYPVFHRKFLEPLADERTDFIFGALENVEKAISLIKKRYDSYSEYIDDIKTTFKIVTNQYLKDYTVEGFQTLKYGTIILTEEDNFAANGILQLYDKILKEKKIPQLLKSFITLKNNKQNKPLRVSQFIEPNALHLGQMGSDFALSISQRKSLYSFLKSNDKIFAINGPPGTGKTTLIQSIVANKMVQSVIIGPDAPVILACSGNNQAVTNIIDSFSRSNAKSGHLQSRWLPEIDGYATYLPANTKSEVELSAINFKKLNGDGLFKEIENQEYLKRAQKFYIKNSSRYFGKPIKNIDEIISNLKEEIIQIQYQLEQASKRWTDYLKQEIVFTDSYLGERSNKEKYYSENLLNEVAFEADLKTLIGAKEKISFYFKTEPFLRKLYCFFGLKSALKTRSEKIQLILNDSLIIETVDFIFTKNAAIEKIDVKILAATSIIESIEKWKKWKIQNSINGNPPKTDDVYWVFEHLKINMNSSPNCFYDELDVSLRHKAFQMAVNYWEGKYLLKLDEDLKRNNFDSKGPKSAENRWRRHAMLTPCFVSTFFMGPKFFSSYEFVKKGEDGSKIFQEPALFDFIDLLLVDEAGQVSPEVGIATFALAKQAAIIGDIKQIEPIWKTTHEIDLENLKICGIIKNDSLSIFNKEFDQKGFLCASGSIMLMAQNACNVKEDGFTEKGAYLTEHRRCNDEIINFCNELAYNGQLKPLKGKAKDDSLFHPMYCIHVNGNSTYLHSSRYNQNEVSAIVNWLLTNRSKIEKKFGKIENALGIITPFTGQKNKLRNALKDAGFDVDILKIGTVHALQGAERHIILFSMVYGEGDSSTMFFDRDNKPNMLNVAVSRAKDNFIVFANTKILDKKAKTPSGILSNYLVYEVNSTNQ